MNEELNQETTPASEPVSEEVKMPQSDVPVTEEAEEKPVRGPVILLLGVLLLAVLVGLVLWFTNINQTPEPVPAPVERPTDEENNEPESTTAEARTDNLETVSSSDEITAIEADLEATNIEALDAELEAIEAELEAGS